MKLLIDIENDYYEIIKYNVEHGDKYKPFEIIANSIPYEERPQGEWIRTGSLGNGNAQYECSNCHYGDEHAESQEVPYCWHCGAYMKGGAE